MSRFTVRGQFRTSGDWQPFETEIEGENESVAIEHCYAAIGSRHGLKRRQIDITEVKPQ